MNDINKKRLIEGMIEVYVLFQFKKGGQASIYYEPFRDIPYNFYEYIIYDFCADIVFYIADQQGIYDKYDAYLYENNIFDVIEKIITDENEDIILTELFKGINEYSQLVDDTQNCINIIVQNFMQYIQEYINKNTRTE